MSESGYNTVDAHLNYQYRAFGVPGLGLKRGLADDLVVAPYASALALMVAPEEACLNLQRLAAEGLLRDSSDSTRRSTTRRRAQRRGQSSAVVRSFMAHHQGMSLLALAHMLLDRPMQRRFESEPLFQATMLLLQERIPKATALFPHTAELSEVRTTAVAAETPMRVFSSPDTPVPEVQLLSNGRYHVMVTNAGGGYSRWKDLAVTRWREDGTCDNWGTFCYIRDVASGAFWSTALSADARAPESYEAIFSEGRAEFRRRDIGTVAAISTPIPRSPFRRRTTSSCAGSASPTVRDSAGTIEVTSYAEVVLAPPVADALHPAFSNLFVQTEIMRDAARHPLHAPAPLAQDEQPPWMLHLMAVHGAGIGEVSYETDRARFIGRGTERRRAPAMSDRAAALRQPRARCSIRSSRSAAAITLDPDETATIDMVSGVGETRDAAVSLVEKYQDRRLADRVFDLAWTHSQVVLRQINASEADAQLYGRLASSVIYANAALARRRQRADAGTAAGSPGCGATPSPATCRSCCCRSATRPISSWCASLSRPTPTGA